MKNRSGEKIKLASIDELLGVVNEESAMEIEISKIHPFKNHPFKVLDDEKMQDLVESVRINGVLTPVLLRMDENEEYEMVSGHRRMHAAQLAGLTTIPAIVRELSDDDAIVVMVDANIQREELLPSEKAFAYKMKQEAMKHQGSRTDLTLGQNVPKFKRTTEAIADGTGESYKQIQRYIRLTELIPELLDLVDNKKLQFTVAVNISYIDKEVQPDTSKVVLDETNNEDVDKEATVDPEKTASTKTNMGAMATILILALVGVAAYYYFKIYKVKKEEDEDDQPEGLETGGLEEIPDEEESEDEDFEENEK